MAERLRASTEADLRSPGEDHKSTRIALTISPAVTPQMPGAKGMEVRKTYIGHDVHRVVRLSEAEASRTGRHLPCSRLQSRPARNGDRIERPIRASSPFRKSGIGERSGRERVRRPGAVSLLAGGKEGAGTHSPFRSARRESIRGKRRYACLSVGCVRPCFYFSYWASVGTAAAPWS